MKELLLFLSPYANPQKDVIAATLAWLADKIGVKFEIYYEAYHSGKHFSPYFPEDHFGSTTIAGFHRERLFLINKLFDVKYAVFGKPELFSHTLLKRIGADIIVETEDLLDLYQRTFSHFNVQLPQEVVLVETRSFQISSVVYPKNRRLPPFKKLVKDLFGKLLSSRTRTLPNLINLSPYCYPEIYHRRALGIGYTSPSNPCLDKIGNFEELRTLFVPDEVTEDLEKQGFDIEVIDRFESDDTYWSITNRIVKRWLKHSDGVAFCDPVLTSYWIPWLCRHKKLAVYETLMESVRGQMRNLVVENNGDKIVYGRQTNDRDITELSKADIIWNIMDPGRPAFPIVEEANYGMYRPEKSYYEFEPNDVVLRTLADERKILCTLLFYCPDIRHTEGLPRILELVALTKIRIGLAITAQWYKMVPEILEMINIPLDSGGVFPYVEPLLCSAGLGVGVEAKGFLKETSLLERLTKSRRIISERLDSRFLPKGHYPFLDTIKDYPYSKTVLKRTSKTGPPFWTIEKSGFEYSISYASPGMPRVLYKSENFIAINQASRDWYPYSPFLVISNLKNIKMMEMKIAARKKAGWMILALDSPLWMYSYYGWTKSKELFDIVNYILRGGATGQLVNANPHTISRYARILDEEGLL